MRIVNRKVTNEKRNWERIDSFHIDVLCLKQGYSAHNEASFALNELEALLHGDPIYEGILEDIGLNTET